VTPDTQLPRRAGGAQTKLDGILLVHKPPGISSAAAVARVKRVLGGPKVGHLGTLDPFASGLLPLCIGEGTKIAPYLNVADKRYVGVVRLGIRTDTLDCTGQVIATAAVPALVAADVEPLVHDFVGPITQVPPAFSALKRGGTRMYELARKGEAPELEPRPVVIHELSIALVDAERLRVRLRCSKGTYVRALARDIGERLGCGAMLESLERTGFGPFDLSDALDIDTLTPERAAAARIGLEEAVEHLRTLRVDAATAARLRSGQQAVLGVLGAPLCPAERARVLARDGNLVAVVAEDGGRWKLERVFRDSASCAP
jgi:tRNA pseudouridine55 synthase